MMMWIFKDITDRYSKKILEVYQSQADDKTYKGKEAELLIIRNKFALGLIESIKKIKVESREDYGNYFEQVLAVIETSLNQVKDSVTEYNIQHKTTFNCDLYESFFTVSLNNFINRLEKLFQKSPAVITQIMDESQFSNNRNVPWVYQFSFMLYDYILESEFALSTNKANRDIFDLKVDLILKYVQSVASINESNSEYTNIVNQLLKSMKTAESEIQQNRSSEPEPSSYFGLFTQSIRQISKLIIEPSKLSVLIDGLIEEFKARTTISDSPTLVY